MKTEPRGRGSFKSSASSDDGASTSSTLILSRSEVEGLVKMPDVIDAIDMAYADISDGVATQPAPTALSLASGSASFLAMAALADRQHLAAVKLLADVPGNAARNLPVQRSVLVLVSQATGACVGIIHGQIPTLVRTAAASAVATRNLARSECRVLGLIGAGNLAVEHVHAMLHVRPIDRVLVWSRTEDTVLRFRERVSRDFPNLNVESMTGPREVVEASDIVCTLTPSRLPLVRGEWFRPGQHINAVGAPPRPDHREIDSAGMARASIFLDSISTAMHESGDVLLAIAEGAIGQSQVTCELGDVIKGKTPGRTSADQITLYNSVGIAMQDLAIGSLLLARARETGVGLTIDLAA